VSVPFSLNRTLVPILDTHENRQVTITSRIDTAVATSAGVNEDIELLKGAVILNPSCRISATRLNNALKAKEDSGLEFWKVIAQNNKTRYLPAEMLIDAFSNEDCYDGTTLRLLSTIVSRPAKRGVSKKLIRHLGGVLRNKDDKQGAVAFWKGVVKTKPNCYECAIQLTETFVHNEETESAIQFWNDILLEVVQKTVPYEIAILQLAKCHLESGDLNSFINQLTAIFASSTASFYLSSPVSFIMDPLNRILMNESPIRMIVDLFEDVKLLNRNIDTFLNNLEKELAARGNLNFDVAIGLAKVMFEKRDPYQWMMDGTKRARRVTEIYIAKGEENAAIEYWKVALSRYPEDTVAWGECIRVLIDTGDLDGAIDIGKKWMTLSIPVFDHDSEASRHLTLAFKAKGEPSAEISYWESQRNGNHWKLAARKVLEARLAAGHFEEVIEFCKQKFERYARSGFKTAWVPEYYVADYMAEAFKQGERLDEALKFWRSVKIRAGEDRIVSKAFANVLSAAKDNDAVITLYTMDPYLASSIPWHAREAWKRKRDPNGAVEFWKHMYYNSSRDWTVMQELEHAFDMKGEVTAAIEFWKAEYRRNDDHWDYWRLELEPLTRAFQKNGCKNAPIRFWTSEYAVHRDEQSGKQLSSAFKAKGNWEEEIEFWKEDILANPQDSFYSQLLLIQASKRRGDLDVIIRVWKELPFRHSEVSVLCTELRDVFETKGTIRGSLKFWEEATSLRPDSSAIRNELGRVRKAEQGLRATLEYMNSQHRFEDDGGL
jgi:tetratricopeptide (TPR) repeat protein